MFKHPINWTRLGTVLLTISGLAWVGMLLLQSIGRHGWGLFIPQNIYWFFVSTILLIFAIALTALNFHQFLIAVQQQPIPFNLAVRLHFVGQVIRYLPGRFWGVLYQINAAREQLSASTITRANIDLMIFSLLGNLIVATMILTVSQTITLFWGISILSGTLIISVATFLGGLTQFFHAVSNLLPVGRFHGFALALAKSQISPSVLLKISLFFLTSWGVYLVAWYVLGLAFNSFVGINMFVLCAWYSVAWMVGFATVLTPGGLGIREAVFIAVAGQNIDPDVLVFAAIFIRVWLMFADILLVAVLFSHTFNSKKLKQDVL